ncbi:MAG: type II secretion system protein GspN, partial [Myxococcota bacterium]
MPALRIVGYIAFFLFAFVIGLYWSFPFESAKDRILRTASKQTKMTITAKSLEPNWVTGAVAKGIKIQTAADAEPIELSQVYVRAHVLPMLTGGRGFTVDAPIAKGDVHADIVQSSKGADIDAQAEGLEIALLPGLAEKTGLKLAGDVDLDVDLFAGTDPKTSEGVLKIKAAGLETLKGGKMSNFPIPELNVGSFDWTIPVKNGEALLEQLTITGGDVDLRVDGKITLGSPLDRSLLNLKVGFK